MIKLFLLNGFLGSGKTTAIQQACVQLSDNNVSVAVITNDQGVQLVDSEFIRGFGVPNRQVTDGCFCCNYNQLDESISSLREADKPEVIFAESVGSCADVVATVVRPLIHFHPELEIVFSVFADAAILLRMLQGVPFCFDDDVNYIYEKQLEEAELLIVNKADFISSEQKEQTDRMIREKFPDKTILFQNSLDKKDIQIWLDTLFHFTVNDATKTSLDIDYVRYGTGEMQLAWLDDELEIQAHDGSAIETGIILINKMYEKIRQKGYPIGHLKFLMKNDQWQKKISFTSNNEPKLKQTSSFMHFGLVTLWMNARVQADPERLRQLWVDAIKETLPQKQCHIISKSLSAFKPGFPKPVHRMVHG